MKMKKKTPLCQRQRKCRRRCRRRCRCCRRNCRCCRRRCRCCRRRCCRRYCNLSRVFIALRDLPFNLFQYFQTTSFKRPVQRNNLTLNKSNEANYIPCLKASIGWTLLCQYSLQRPHNPREAIDGRTTNNGLTAHNSSRTHYCLVSYNNYKWPDNPWRHQPQHYFLK